MTTAGEPPDIQAKTDPDEVPSKPPIATAPLSVLLPIHNATAHLAETVRSWTTYLDSLNRPYEIILINDGSADDTAGVANQLAEHLPQLRVLHHEQRRGFGASLRTGLATAHHPLLFYARGDPHSPPTQLKLLLERIDEVDLVSGYRAGVPVPLAFRITGFCWRFFIRWVFGLPLEPLPGWLGWQALAYHKTIRCVFGVRIGDVDSACKLFRRGVFDRIPIQSDGNFVHAEILAKANFLGFEMTEIALAEPADWQPDARRWSEGYRVFADPDFGPAVLKKDG